METRKLSKTDILSTSTYGKFVGYDKTIRVEQIFDILKIIRDRYKGIKHDYYLYRIVVWCVADKKAQTIELKTDLSKHFKRRQINSSKGFAFSQTVCGN